MKKQPRPRASRRSYAVRLAIVLGAVTIVQACADESRLVEPTLGIIDVEPAGVSMTRSGAAVTPAEMERGLDRQARALALALGQVSEVRAVLAAELESSSFREGRIEFRRVMNDEASGLSEAMGAASGRDATELRASIDSLLSLELYFPVDDHRTQWTGDENLLVLPFFSDNGDETTVDAYDLSGERVTLSLGEPPTQPTLVLTPAEVNFAAAALPRAASRASEEYDAVGSKASTISGAAGLYMTYSYLADLHEPWPLGDPEIAVHVAVYDASSDIMEWESCAGDDASGSYYFDQNSNTWNDTVLIAPKSGIEDSEYEVFVWEDDHNRCDGTNNLAPHQSTNFLVDLLSSLLKYGGEVKDNYETLDDSTTSAVDRFKAIASIVTGAYELAGTVAHDDLVGVGEKLSGGGCYTGDGYVQLELMEEDEGGTNSYIRVEENFGMRTLCAMSASITGDTQACPYDDPTGSMSASVTAPGAGVTYQWKEDGVVRGTSSSYQIYDRHSPGWKSVDLRVIRTEDGYVDYSSRSVQVFADGAGPCPQ